eukprot:PhF_6_TR8512/c0_g1_i1/m.13323
MEMECKVVLSGLEAMEKLRPLLGHTLAMESQENHFFDSPDNALSRSATTLRLRILPEKSIAECTLKEDAHTTHGTTLRWNTSALFPLTFAQQCLDDPDTLVTHDSPISAVLRSKYSVQTLKYVGGFRTSRRVFGHPGSEVQRSGLTLKLDTVEYPFGTQYEVEVAGVVVPISDVLEELCLYLGKVGVAHEKSEGSKYEIFIKGMQQSMMSGDLRSSSVCLSQSQKDETKQ